MDTRLRYKSLKRVTQAILGKTITFCDTPFLEIMMCVHCLGAIF